MDPEDTRSGPESEWGGEAVEALDSQFLKIQAVMGRMEMGQ